MNFAIPILSGNQPQSQEPFHSYITNQQAMFFFQITDQKTFETVFLYRWPNDVDYHESSEYFHRFKFEFGFIGFSFFEVEEAKKFSTLTTQMNQMRKNEKKLL